MTPPSDRTAGQSEGVNEGLAGQPRAEREQLAERSKVMLGRSVNGKKELWWRVTIYVGDSREDIDFAVSEALRVDAHMRAQR